MVDAWGGFLVSLFCRNSTTEAANWHWLAGVRRRRRTVTDLERLLGEPRQQKPSGWLFFGDQSENLLDGCRFDGGGDEFGSK